MSPGPPGPDERLAIEILGDYILRREQGQPLTAGDVLARAAEHGPAVRQQVRVLLHLYTLIHGPDEHEHPDH